MDPALLKRQFETIGARLEIEEGAKSFSIDVIEDRGKERFLIRFGPEVMEPTVLNVMRERRHLLLMLREADKKTKARFLCGFDERHWFVAAVPEASGASTVRAAMQDLKPAAVQAAEEKAEVKPRDRFRRRNGGWRRQGEWFFIPRPEIEFDPQIVLKHEPLRRGRGKAHMAEECVRRGGITVYVCGRHPNGLAEAEYKLLLQRQPPAKRWGWRTMRRDMEVFVRGTIRHPDHKTLHLAGWHKVEMNTETQAVAMRHVVFLD